MNRGAKAQSRVLGELTVTRDGAVVYLGGRRQRAVLAALLVTRGQAVPADRLADCVWGDVGPANTTAAIWCSLIAAVSAMRESCTRR